MNFRLDAEPRQMLREAISILTSVSDPNPHQAILVLTDGIQMRGSRKTPFLEGRFRIFLPGARHVGWEEAGLLALKLEESLPEKVGAGTSDSDGR